MSAATDVVLGDIGAGKSQIIHRSLTAPQNAERAETEDAPLMDQAPITPYRDVCDVRLNQSLSLTALLLSALLVVSLGVIVYLATRPTQQVIIERSSEGDRVITVNGQAVGNGVAVGTDKPGAREKTTLVREWTALRYSVDPLTREKDLKRMFEMMLPSAATTYSNLMTKSGEAQLEVRENWRTVWKPQVIEVDRVDSYRVNVVGTMEITKRAPKGEEREMKQLMFGLHLTRDTDQDRAPRNAWSGFLIDDILDYRELPVEVSSSVSTLKQTQ